MLQSRQRASIIRSKEIPNDCRAASRGADDNIGYLNTVYHFGRVPFFFVRGTAPYLRSYSRNNEGPHEYSSAHCGAKICRAPKTRPQSKALSFTGIALAMFAGIAHAAFMYHALTGRAPAGAETSTIGQRVPIAIAPIGDPKDIR